MGSSQQQLIDSLFAAAGTGLAAAEASGTEIKLQDTYSSIDGCQERKYEHWLHPDSCWLKGQSLEIEIDHKGSSST